MQKVMIIGCCGAGKSSLARRLHEKTDLPLIHLDQHYHLPEWQEPSKEDWQSKMHKLVSGDRWIIDGNYGGTMDIRMSKADTIIYMDYPTVRCLWRVIKRTWKFHGAVRPDMPAGCPERFNLEFLHYVATYNLTRRKGIFRRIEKAGIVPIIIRNDRAAKAYIDGIAGVTTSA